MAWERLEEIGADLLRRLGPGALRSVVEHAMAGWPREAILRDAHGTEPLLDALLGTDQSAALAYLTGLAAGYAQHAGEVSVETVWSGPPLPITCQCAPRPRCSPTSSARPGTSCC